MSGVPKQFDKKQVLNKALQCFWANGYEATSMQDLVKCMGINRASMYDTFGNKRELFCQALDAYCHMALQNIEALLNAPGSPLANLANYFSVLSAQASSKENYGCFANNAAIEMGPHDPGIADKILCFWQAVESLLKDTLDRAIAEGEIAGDTDSGDLARLINATSQGLAAMSKVGVDMSLIKQTAAQLIGLLHAD